MDKAHYILWLVQVLTTVHVTGRFALIANRNADVASMTQKTSAPTKNWTSRGWWREIPGQNETKLYPTSSKYLVASNKRLDEVLNFNQRDPLENTATANKMFLDLSVPITSKQYGENPFSVAPIIDAKEGIYSSNFKTRKLATSMKVDRKSFKRKKKGSLIKRESYHPSKYSTNTLGFPFLLYTAALEHISNSTNILPLKTRKKLSLRRKLKSNEGNKKTLRSPTPNESFEHHVHRVFASTGSSSGFNLSSLNSKPFEGESFWHVKDTQAFAYPASNGLTQIDKDYFRMIREEAGPSNLFFTNVSTILKHSPNFKSLNELKLKDLHIKRLNRHGDETKRNIKIYDETKKYTKKIYGNDMNRAENGPNKDANSSSNEPRLLLADLLQTPRLLKWDNKSVDERKNDSKNIMKGGSRSKSVKTKRAMFKITKNKKREEQKSLQKYKNALRKFYNFWRHADVKRKIFNANDDDNGQKQTWKKEIKSFLRKASPHLHSKNNSIYEDMMIEYKEDAMGNNNGCHVDVGNKKFERNSTHGQFVPLSEKDKSQENKKSREKQWQHRGRKKTNTTFEKHRNKYLNLDQYRALVAEKDLELIHHKHFAQKHSGKKHRNSIFEKEEPVASIEKSKSNKNPSIRNRPKFVYHTVPGSSINYISNEAMRDENISHLLTDERKPYLHTIDSISGGSDKLSDRPQIPMIVIKDRQRRSHKRIETSFSDRYLTKTFKQRKTRPLNVVAVSLPDPNITSSNRSK